MPTALERTGDFSQTTVQGAPVTIYDPTTGSPFPGNRIPANRINATSTALLQYFPNPNLPFATRNYQTSWSGAEQLAEPELAHLQHQASAARTASTSASAIRAAAQSRRTCSSSSTPARAAASTPIWRGRGPSPRRLINNLHYNFSRMPPAFLAVFRRSRERGGGAGHRRHVAEPHELGAAQPELHQLRRPHRRQLLAQPQPDQRGRRQPHLGPRQCTTSPSAATTAASSSIQLADTNGRGTYTFNGSATSLRW